MALTLRATKGSRLTTAEMDANLSGLADGTLMTGGPMRVGISTDTIYSRWYRADATFSGTVNHGTFYGYNITGFGQIEDSAKASLMWGFEADYNDGSIRALEFHTNMAVPGGSFKRPFYAAMAITGGNAGKIIDTNVLSEVNINLFSPKVSFEAAAVYTLGADFHLVSLDTGGKNWSLLSSGSGAGKGAGHLVFYNNTNSRYGLVLDALGSVLLGDAAVLATTATDGFVYVPTCAGTPTGVPVAKTGLVPLVFDTTGVKLWFYTGGAWKGVVVA